MKASQERWRCPAIINTASVAIGILEEENPEPELLKHALQDVAEALGNEQDFEKLDRILSVQGSAEIYNLGLWLDKLGLKL